MGRSKGSLSHTKGKLVHNFPFAWCVCVCICACVLYSCECRDAHVEAKGDYWFTLFFERSLTLLELAVSAGFISGAYPVTGIHCPASPQDPSTYLSPSAGLTSSTLSFYTSAGDLDTSLCAGTASALSTESLLQFLPGYFSPVSKLDHPLAQSGLVKEPKQAISVMILAGMNIF